MNDWRKFDAVDVLLSHISKTYSRKSATVKHWAADLIEGRVWRGGTSRVRVRVVKKRAGKEPRKQKRSKSTSVTPPPLKVWTKGQREEATRKKADEVDAAALSGVRRSRRARVSTEKVLNGQ
jgi:hypothetical protein